MVDFTGISYESFVRVISMFSLGIIVDTGHVSLAVSHPRLCTVITIAVIFVSYGFNALADAIDHAKGSRCLYETWHVFKMMSYAPIFAWVLYLIGTKWYIYILILLVLKVVWEMLYRAGRFVKLDKLDDRFRSRIFQVLLGFKRKE